MSTVLDTYDEQIADTQPGSYYVSCFDPQSPKRHYLMSGPYTTHQEALAMVSKAHSMAEDLDARAAWMAFGTCRYPEDYTVPGRLQRIAGYSLQLTK